MKTIDELRAEIKAAHERQMEELRALDAELDAIKAKMDGEQWPKDGDEYWTCSDGCIDSVKWDGGGIDNNLRVIGNCFAAKAEAEKHRDWLKAVAEIRRMIGEQTGIHRPIITDGPSYTFVDSNPFGCETEALAIKVASSPAFKTFLGVD